MKKLPPSGYVTAADSMKSGYLAKKFKAIQSANERIRAEKDRQNAENMREAAEKTIALPTKEAA